jgi:hypothetical protein
MTENRTNRSGVAPAILIVIAVVGLLLGFGRCGFLQPAVRPAEDYGISGAFFLVVGLTLLIVGLVWLNKRRKHP